MNIAICTHHKLSKSLLYKWPLDRCLNQSICQLLIVPSFNSTAPTTFFSFATLTLFSFSHWTTIKPIFRSVILSKTVEKRNNLWICQSQSSAHLSGRLDEMRSLTNKSLSTLTVIGLLLDLTPTLFALLNLGSWCFFYEINPHTRLILPYCIIVPPLDFYKGLWLITRGNVWVMK